ncbi:MAG: MarP family serine protease [Chloroflexota bacterium]
MNLFDVGVVILLVVAVILGYRSGALPQVGGLAGAILGGVLAILALTPAEGLLGTLDPGFRAVAVLLWLLLAVGVGEGIGSGIARYVAYRLGSGLLSGVDRVAGGLLGAAQAILVVWLAGGLLAAGPVPRLAAQAQTSTTLRALSAVLPAPTEIAVGLGGLLDDTGLPKLFVGLEPTPALPVDRPDDPRARAIAAAAEASTVKVTAQTCGALSTGTGFAVATDYVVTNAHVVAGGNTVRVSLAGSPFDAAVVLFDPDLDVALLWVPRLPAPPLRFAATEPQRGDTGAALGFPGGGGMVIVPAAVANRYEARGRDIYDDHTVTRRILELRAAIDRGDSGGPFVLADGSVGGIVFAEARTDEDVGYALSAEPVAVRIGPGVGRTSEVAVGDCIR